MGMRLVVYVVYFGPMPPWFNLTLLSMRRNADVTFAIVGDRIPTAGGLPQNVLPLRLSYDEYQIALQTAFNVTVSYRKPCAGVNCGLAASNKASDTRPFLGRLFSNITRRHDWWAWMDMDVVLGRLSRLLRLDNAHDIACPLAPAMHSWGPFTALRVNFSLDPYELAGRERWRRVLQSPRQVYFEELGSDGFGMSHALRRSGARALLSPEGRPWPLGEGRPCVGKLPNGRIAHDCKPTDERCWWQTLCGAAFAQLDMAGRLRVNGREVLLLHLSFSKAAWHDWAAAGHSVPAKGNVCVVNMGVAACTGSSHAVIALNASAVAAHTHGNRVDITRLGSAVAYRLHPLLQVGPCGDAHEDGVRTANNIGRC